MLKKLPGIAPTAPVYKLENTEAVAVFFNHEEAAYNWALSEIPTFDCVTGLLDSHVPRAFRVL